MDVVSSILRWFHVIAAILWVGHLWFFNLVNAHVSGVLDADTKRKVVPELMTRALFWFRWGALLTWATGMLLLGLNFYHGKQALPQGTAWTPPAFAMLGLTFLAVFLYDVLAKTVLRPGRAMFWGGFALVVLVLIGYRTVGFTGRGTQIHLGAMLGTIMAWNVWFVIWPAWKWTLAALKSGETPDAALAASAAERSRHNMFMSVAVIFLMLNEHHATWAFRWETFHVGEESAIEFPWITALGVLVSWQVAHHLLGISRKVKPA